MTEEEKRTAATARNAYARKWRAENPDKVRANNERYWLNKAKRAAGKPTESLLKVKEVR